MKFEFTIPPLTCCHHVCCFTGAWVGKASLFRNGGRVGITEFSWSPTNMKAFTSRKECEKENKGLPCFNQKSGRDSKDYLIPT